MLGYTSPLFAAPVRAGVTFSAFVRTLSSSGGRIKHCMPCGIQYSAYEQMLN